jgi:hypothetical protein
MKAKKKGPMGEAAAQLLAGATGADALAAVTEDAAPPKARNVVRVEEDEERVIVTNVRLRVSEWTWLHREAMERKLAKPGSRADASAVVRELVQEAMRRRRR